MADPELVFRLTVKDEENDVSISPVKLRQNETLPTASTTSLPHREKEAMLRARAMQEKGKEFCTYLVVCSNL